MEKRQVTSKYRVLKHGTHGLNAIPFFHTPIETLIDRSQVRRTMSSASDSFAIPTVLRYTASPSDRTPVHRALKHRATVKPYTRKWGNTVLSYTGIRPNTPVRLRFLTDNCTKLRSKLYNFTVDVLEMKRGGAS